MPTHVRIQARDLVVTQLTGLATTGDNVFVKRTRAVAKSQLPALSIGVGDGDVTPITQRAPRRQERTDQLHVDLIVEAEDEETADALLHTILLEVETALLPGEWSAGVLFDITPRAISEVYDGDGNQIAGQLRLTCEIQTQTAEGAPGVILP